jgi:hypothetical protein
VTLPGPGSGRALGGGRRAGRGRSRGFLLLARHGNTVRLAAPAPARRVALDLPAEHRPPGSSSSALRTPSRAPIDPGRLEKTLRAAPTHDPLPRRVLAGRAPVVRSSASPGVSPRNPSNGTA